MTDHSDRDRDLASRLADLAVRDPEGHDHRLGDLWRDQPRVLAFVRHFG